MKINKHIEILRTEVTHFSSMNYSSALKIQAALRRRYTSVGISTINSPADLMQLVQLQPDLAFLGLKRLPFASDQSIWLADFLDQHHINYTGSRANAIELDFDKAQSKNIVRLAGLDTADYFTARPGQHTADKLPFSYPFFVKPLSTGGGKGIDDDSVVRTFSQFQQKVASIYTAYRSSSLVEQYLEGREFTVAILETPFEDVPLVMPVEIITKKNHGGDRILGSKVKGEDNERVVAVQDELISVSVCRLALETYRLLGGRDLARIDIRMDSSDNPNFLEANFVPAPGTRYFAGACLINERMNYEAVILAIVEQSLARGAIVSSFEHPTAMELVTA